MKIERFEDILSWQEARGLVKSVYAAIDANERFRKDFRLANQIQSASVSCMANMAEGFCRHSRKEFIQFLYVAKGSAAEIQSHLYVALDLSTLGHKFGDVFLRRQFLLKTNRAEFGENIFQVLA